MARETVMDECDVVILGSAAFEDSGFVKPFAILIRERSDADASLRGFLAAHAVSHSPHISVANLIADVETAVRENKPLNQRRLFEAVSRLDFGKVRTFVRFSCRQQNLNEEIRKSLQSFSLDLRWPEGFASIE